MNLKITIFFINQSSYMFRGMWSLMSYESLLKFLPFIIKEWERKYTKSIV